MSAENPKYWALLDDERFSHVTIQGRLNELHEDCDGHLPETIEMIGYDRKVADPKWFIDSVIEYFIERLDEEYGGEDETTITREMKQLTEEYVNKIIAKYKVWQCDPVCQKIVKVSDYIKKDHPI